MEQETLLQKLGYIRHNPESHAPHTNLLYYNGPDGSIRWLWPAESKQPHFLRFYHQAGWRARLFVRIVRLIFSLRLQHRIFPSVRVCSHAQPLAMLTGTEWAVFTGTPGPNRKIVAYARHNGSGYFQKLALGENAGALLRNEAATLQRLRSMPDRTFTVPVVLTREQGTVCVSDIGERGKSTDAFTSAHAALLKEMRDQTLGYAFLHTLPAWEDTCTRLQQLERLQDARIPAALLRKLRRMMQAFPSDYLVDTTVAHGDFTPWNMYQQDDGTLAVYDWELSRPAMPFGFDAFHFIIQNGILTQRLRWTDLEKTIQQTLFTDQGLFARYAPAAQRNYLALYLIINTTYYLSVYAQQPAWHRQVSWLLETWSLALSSIASAYMQHRKLVLMDLSDYLAAKPYAALKYPRQFPEHLPETSDLDLCMSKRVYRDLTQFLNNHPLISLRNRTVQSFMANEMLILRDGSMLSLDCIWKFKRKNLVMMPMQPVIDRASYSFSGMRIACEQDTARFVGLFYTLNHTAIPDAYAGLQTALSPTSSFDQMLRAYYRNACGAEAIISAVTEATENSGVKKIQHTITYAFDVVRRLLGRRAPVITFSGVDGAGKSTVIENLRNRIEKQLRKPVVVLRHRPSLFPILSALTKGKAAAERAAAESLPRQGTNTSLLSSLLRFAYYYIDYLVGQWYVWFRYSVRGYVVLYDRYYFDFIHDSRRSNIHLPPALTRWFYRFIRTPDLNFFLFAAPETIRARKQELDTTTIRELTEQYHSFFHQLGKRNRNRYVTIENVDLPTTLTVIMNRVSRIAA